MRAVLKGGRGEGSGGGNTHGCDGCHVVDFAGGSAGEVGDKVLLELLVAFGRCGRHVCDRQMGVERNRDGVYLVDGGRTKEGPVYSKRRLQARYHFCRCVCFDTRANGRVTEAVGPLERVGDVSIPTCSVSKIAAEKNNQRTTPHCVGCSRVVQAPDLQVTDAIPGSPLQSAVRCTLPNQELQIEASCGSTPEWLRRHGWSRKPYLTLKLFPPPCFLRRSKEAFPPSRGWCLGCPDL